VSELLRMPGEVSTPIDPPSVILRPCDYGLERAWCALETQLGTIEGYNRLAAFANHIHTLIEAGNIKPQNPIFSVSTCALRARKGVAL
jgi:hypothetical protein